jgi:hypothetical protein
MDALDRYGEAVLQLCTVHALRIRVLAVKQRVVLLTAEQNELPAEGAALERRLIEELVQDAAGPLRAAGLRTVVLAYAVCDGPSEYPLRKFAQSVLLDPDGTAHPVFLRLGRGKALWPLGADGLAAPANPKVPAVCVEDLGEEEMEALRLKSNAQLIRWEKGAYHRANAPAACKLHAFFRREQKRQACLAKALRVRAMVNDQ